MYWVLISLMTLAAEVPPPEGIVINWLVKRFTAVSLSSSLCVLPHISCKQDTSDVRDYRYVTLMRTIYKAATASTIAIMMNTLNVLFANIQDDALSFLTGIWLTSLDDDELAVLALGHSVALLEAFKSTCAVVDFQTVLPSLLVALQSPSLKIREYALQCLRLMSESTQTKFKRVYAFDVIYGHSASKHCCDYHSLPWLTGSFQLNCCISLKMILRIIWLHWLPTESITSTILATLSSSTKSTFRN